MAGTRGAVALRGRGCQARGDAAAGEAGPQQPAAADARLAGGPQPLRQPAPELAAAPAALPRQPAPRRVRPAERRREPAEGLDQLEPGRPGGCGQQGPGLTAAHASQARRVWEAERQRVGAEAVVQLQRQLQSSRVFQPLVSAASSQAE